MRTVFTARQCQALLGAAGKVQRVIADAHAVELQYAAVTGDEGGDLGDDVPAPGLAPVGKRGCGERAGLPITVRLPESL